MNIISPTELRDRLASQPKPTLIDVRTPAEFDEIHVPEARNIPLDQLNQDTIEALRQTNTMEPIYVICQSGTRGKKACETLSKAEIEVCNVDGGTTAWAKQGFPVTRGKKSVSLERQVRIAAGSLVLSGALLASFIHPNWIWLSGFVGAGLVFAGITDTCGMGMLIAKMPWNQSRRH